MKKSLERRGRLINDTVHFRADLLDRGETALHHKFIQTFLSSVVESHDTQLPHHWTSSTVIEKMLATAREASLFCVTSEMWETIIAAAETIPAEPLQAVDLPRPVGYLQVPPGSWVSRDINGIDNEIIAAMWEQDEKKESVRIWLFMDIQTPTGKDVTLPPEILRHMPRLSLYHTARIPFGQFIFTAPQGIGREEADQIIDVLSLLRDNAYDADSPFLEVTTLNGNTYQLSPSDHMRQLKSFFAFIRTKITVTSREMPSKATTKSLPAELRNTDISVVELRKASYTGKPKNTSGKAWTHRRLVKSHWRRVWVGTGDDKHQRWTPIESYVAGPPDAPFKRSTVVNRVSR